MELDLLKKIGLALALGMLVGIEREFSQRREGEPLFAGSRTFALLALLGAISGYLASHTSPLILLGALLIVGALIAMSYFLSVRSGGHLGTTTEISAPYLSPKRRLILLESGRFISPPLLPALPMLMRSH